MFQKQYSVWWWPLCLQCSPNWQLSATNGGGCCSSFLHHPFLPLLLHFHTPSRLPITSDTTGLIHHRHVVLSIWCLHGRLYKGLYPLQMSFTMRISQWIVGCFIVTVPLLKWLFGFFRTIVIHWRCFNLTGNITFLEKWCFKTKKTDLLKNNVFDQKIQIY